MDLDLKGKTAVVCGSTQGLGYASAVELALLGCNVVLMARDEGRLKTAAESLYRLNDQHHTYIAADFTNTASVKEEIKKYTSGNPVHILVNNTGGPAGGTAIDAEPEAFLTAFNNHLINNHNLTQAVVPGMKDAGFGRIINIIYTSVKKLITFLGESNTIR